MLRQTRPLQAPGEDSITSALRSAVKRRNSTTCAFGLLSASPGLRSHGFESGVAIVGITAVVKWVASPQAALTKAEQSTPVTSVRGSLRVQLLPAMVPRSIGARICSSEALRPQQ